MSSTAEYKFEAWAGVDDKAVKGGMVFIPFTPKEWDEDDVDVKVMYCGICGSDYHDLSGEWGAIKEGDIHICGHEIVGEVVKVGCKVENGLKVGDMVGIGAQSDSCRECEWCKSGQEQICHNITWTMGVPYQHGRAGASGSLSRGGFSKYWRGPSRFVIPLPSTLDPASAAPMFCGGITVYSPLEEYDAGGKAKRVGVIGVGGLGHYAILFGKAMGAEITAISRGREKEEDARKLGADRYIAMSEGIEGYENSLDLIICTINPDNLDAESYMPLLRPYGTMCLVGITPNPVPIRSQTLIGRNRKIAGSNVGSPAQIRRMLDLAERKVVESWIKRWKMEEINEALEAFGRGEPRFRFVLVNEDNGGKL